MDLGYRGLTPYMRPSATHTRGVVCVTALRQSAAVETSNRQIDSVLPVLICSADNKVIIGPRSVLFWASTYKIYYDLS